MGFAAATGWSAPYVPLSSSQQLLSMMMSSAISSVGLIGFGTLCGLLMPRPRFLEGSAGRTGALLSSAPPGTLIRRLAIVFHGAVIVRDIWNHHIAAEAHAALLAAWSWLCGCAVVATAAKQKSSEAQRQQQQQQQSLVTAPTRSEAPRNTHSQRPITASSTQGWYVTEEDLAFFKRHCESDEPLQGATPWVPQMDKDFATFSYAAWRRILPSGKAEYKSVTVSLNATAEEFTDFYLDDDVRPQWDTMVSHHDVLEVGSPADRCQVVYWIRSFPFAFLSDRAYIIARRQFRDGNGCIYVCTKGIEHDRDPQDTSVVRMDVFWSMWRSRTIPCPRGSDKPACETVLLHHEQFKIPENLARFAIKTGMAGFVKKMGPAVRSFVDSRRQRVDAFAADPEAYGVTGLSRTASIASLDTNATDCTDGIDSRSPNRAPQSHRRQKQKRSPLKRVVIASIGVAGVVALTRGGRGLPALAASASRAFTGLLQRRQQRSLHCLQQPSDSQTVGQDRVPSDMTD